MCVGKEWGERGWEGRGGRGEGEGKGGEGRGGGERDKQTNKQERDVGRSRMVKLGEEGEEEKCESIKAI